MKNFLTTGLVAVAMLFVAADLGSAAESSYQTVQSQARRGAATDTSKCRTPSEYAQMIKTGRC
jgi:hypothetical protein